MNLPWLKIAGIAGRVGLAVLTGVPIAETMAQTISDRTGAAKSAAVLDLVASELTIAGAACGRDLTTAPGVIEAVEKLIDAFVSLHNVLAAAAGPPRS